jgi:hypothetical protein
MSDVTGGNIQIVTNIKSLLTAIENVNVKLQPGVVLALEGKQT